MIIFLKRFKGILIFIGIESYFYSKKQPKDLEMFFLTWAFIALALLVFNIFNLDGSTMGFGGRARSYFFSFTEKKGTEKSKGRSFGGISDSINLLYLLCAIANIIAYILIIRKKYY